MVAVAVLLRKAGRQEGRPGGRMREETGASNVKNKSLEGQLTNHIF